MIFRSINYLALFVMVFFVISPSLVVAEPPFSDKLGKGHKIRSFEITCDNTQYLITQHFKYEDGIYSEFTLSKGKKLMLFSARPSKVEYSEKKNTFKSGYSVEWSEIAVGIRGVGNILSYPAGGAVDLMTIVISTNNTNTANDIWSVIKINKQEAYLTDDGYLSSSFSSKDEKSRCSMKNLKLQQN